MKQILAILLVLVTLTSCNLAKKVATPIAAPKADSTLVANEVIDRVQQTETSSTSLNVPKFDLDVSLASHLTLCVALCV